MRIDFWAAHLFADLKSSPHMVLEGRKGNEGRQLHVKFYAASLEANQLLRHSSLEAIVSGPLPHGALCAGYATKASV